MRASSNLLRRIVSAVVLGLIVIWGVVWSNFLLNLLLAVGGVIAGSEWTRIVDPRTRPGTGLTNRQRQRAVSVLPCILLLLWLVATRIPPAGYGFELASVTLLLLAARLVPQLKLSLLVICGLPYIGATLLSLLALHKAQHWHALVFLLIMVWTTDTFAFIVGKLVGGPKLAPRVSPGKTRSGALGGLCAAAAAGAAVSGWLGTASPPHAMLVAIGISVLTQAGDLAESALKRRFGVKDSGWLIPGHGGILDRIDGLLLATPVFTIYLLWFGGTV